MIAKNIDEIKNFIYTLKNFEKNEEAIDECDHFLAVLDHTNQSVNSFKFFLAREIRIFSKWTNFAEDRKEVQKKIFVNCFM